MVRHHGLLLLGHIPQTQSSRIKASEYPLDEEGDNLNSYGGKKERIYAEHGGLLDFWDITISQRRESRNKVGDASERNKIGKI